MRNRDKQSNIDCGAGADSQFDGEANGEPARPWVTVKQPGLGLPLARPIGNMYTAWHSQFAVAGGWGWAVHGDRDGIGL